MSLDRDNVIQAFGWFKDLMDADIDAKLAGLSYTLPAATEYDLGGVKVGDGLEMDADNRLNVTISGGESNVIEAITVDGQNQPVTNKTAALNMSAYAKKTDVANALSSISSLSLAINSLKVGDKNVIEAIKVDGTTVQPDASKTVNLNLSATYAKKSEVASGVRMKGSVDFFSDLANLPEAPAVGDLYNIKTAGDYDGTPILAGDNVVYTDKGTWDVMAGFVDTSTFVEKVAGKQLSTNDFTNADKAKLDSLSNATPYTLPAATTTTRGGIRPGEGLEMRKDIKSGDDTDILDCTLFVGATATTPGIAGMVPAPGAGQQGEFLCCDGNWTPLPVATSIKSGIVMIGAGLSISSGVLSCTATGGTDDVFEGATSIKGGASGLVPAPLMGENEKFLCGNGKWEDVGKYVSIVNTGGSTGVVVGTDPTAVQGALWMDYLSDGTVALKLRRDNYEYNFIPDSSNISGSNLPALDTSNKGQIYYLGTTASTVNGGLWYEMENDAPKLGLHYGNNLIFDYFYYHDSVTYKGGPAHLISYISCNTIPPTDAFNILTSQYTIASDTTGRLATGLSLPGGYGLTCDTDSANKNYVQCKVPFDKTNGRTIDWWFTLLPAATSITADRVIIGSSTILSVKKVNNVWQLSFPSGSSLDKSYPVSSQINVPHHVRVTYHSSDSYGGYGAMWFDGKLINSKVKVAGAGSATFDFRMNLNPAWAVSKLRVYDTLPKSLTDNYDPPTLDDYT